MTDEGNPVGNNRADWLENASAAFGLHRFSAGGHESPGMGDCVGGRLIAAERQVRGEQRARLGAGGGADMVLHLRHGYVRRVRIAEHDHAERIPHQQQRDARFVEQLGDRVVVNGQRRDFFAALLHCPNIVRRDFRASHDGTIAAEQGSDKGKIHRPDRRVRLPLGNGSSIRPKERQTGRRQCHTLQSVQFRP